MATVIHRHIFLIVLLIITIIAIPTILVIASADEPCQSAQYGEDKPAAIQVSWAYAYGSFEELSKASDLIAVGRIEKIDSVTSVPVGLKTEEGEPRIYFTQYLFKIETVLKGEKVEQVIVNQTGAGNEQIVTDDPLYSVGETYVMFLREYEPGKYYTLGGPQGRYLIGDEGTISSMNRIYADQVIIPMALDIENWPKDSFIKTIADITD